MSEPRLYACPVCADTFQRAWYRDEHFDAFHIVLDATLLPHDTPVVSARRTSAPAIAPRLPKREKAESPEREARAVRVKPKLRSSYMHVYVDNRRSKGWYFQIYTPEKKTFQSPYFATEAETVRAYAEEMRRRGHAAEMPPLRAACNTEDPSRLAPEPEPQ